MWRSLRLRLLFAMVLVVVVAVGVTGAVASQRTLSEFESYVEHSGSTNNRRFTAALGRLYGTDQKWTTAQTEVERMAQISGRRVVIADAQGQIVGDSDHTLVGKPASANWAHSASPIMAGDTQVGTLYLDPTGGPNPADVAFISAINRSTLYGAGVATLAAIAVTLILAGGILRPVERLTAAARRMKTGDLSVQVPVESKDEIGELGHAFNAMAGSLAQQEQLAS